MLRVRRELARLISAPAAGAGAPSGGASPAVGAEVEANITYAHGMVCPRAVSSCRWDTTNADSVDPPLRPLAVRRSL